MSRKKTMRRCRWCTGQMLNLGEVMTCPSCDMTPSHPSIAAPKEEGDAETVG